MRSPRCVPSGKPTPRPRPAAAAHAGLPPVRAARTPAASPVRGSEEAGAPDLDRGARWGASRPKARVVGQRAAASAVSGDGVAVGSPSLSEEKRRPGNPPPSSPGFRDETGAARPGRNAPRPLQAPLPREDGHPRAEQEAPPGETADGATPGVPRTPAGSEWGRERTGDSMKEGFCLG